VRAFAAAVGTAALALGAPAVSGALVFCAGSTGAECTGGTYPATGDGLQNAIAAADTNVDIGGGSNTVRIGLGTYKRTNGAGFHTVGGNIEIEGAGQATVLTTDAASNRTVLGVDGSASAAAVRNLRVDIAGDANGIFQFQRVSDVRVTGPGRAIVAISLLPGARLSRAVIDPASFYFEGVTGYGPVTIEDVAILMRRGTASDIAVGLNADPAAANTEATVRHLTVLGDGQPITRGVLSQAIGPPNGPHTLTVNVRDSVLRNLSTPLVRDGDTSADPAKRGVANIAYRYSSLDETKNSGTNDGAFLPGPGNLADPDPLFAPDLSPGPGSPLIDSGDPAGPEAGESPIDVAGFPRVAGTRRDIGAFEFRPPGTADGLVGPIGTPPTLTVASASGLALSPEAFRAAARGPSVSAARRAKVGTTVRYVLNVDASVRFSVRQSLPGRRVTRRGKVRCVKPSAKLRKARRCKRSKTRGAFTQAGRAGSNAFRFRGRARGRKLKPGRYVLVAVPAANGLKGAAIRTPFRIVR
jgi:hypothetical protein